MISAFDQYLIDHFRLVDGVVHGRRKVVAGCNIGRGYIGTGVRYEGKIRRVMMHRLIYLLAHKEAPEQIDHINGDPSDNRLENLRAATRRDNQANRSGYASTGFKGVTLRTKRYAKPRYEAVCDGRYIGIFDTPEEAAAAYDAAAHISFGAFAKTNYDQLRTV